ncbi:ATP-binding protein [Clostridium cellulovorans]|uniref:M protein-like MukB domain-containing protein n=1 Tax=Clostridium cellulovorans (strain ATCC 35296 / DSM 3052 / OCM 3 / 743B) TaxID=573061 RepID=D9SSK6_CLOC7|nr:SbcC/MukB-like Walker B domain-containing protein [Clostridium cellulovorans]ADL50603.1 M protein-like MukB domain-containing protein [Clostridium cellulovorans 743B]
MMMKKLCRIRLINWHYFVNETINVSGSFLISGENTAGKSTILDAIQLVLTTNNRKFNTAANEKSNRDLKGYVRCKTGNENKSYIRMNSVITYVALEFYEEKTGKYFTLGVKIDSPDEESKLTTKWFREECKLEELSFLKDGRPATAEEFRRKDKKVQLISQVSEAKARFAQRLGNLEDRFFDMIPKSLAFKPMDNVKDFINKFILSEKTIEVSTLRNNIAALKELEDLMELTKEKIAELDRIISKNNDILAKKQEIKTNEILIKKAEIEAKKLECEKLEQSRHICEQRLIDEQNNETTLKKSLENERERFTNLQIVLGQNETTQLIVNTKHRIEILQKDKQVAEASVKKLHNMLSRSEDALSLINKYEVFILSKEELSKVGSADFETEEKIKIVYKLKKEFQKLQEGYSSELVRTKDLLDKSQKSKATLENEIKNLKNRKFTYPENTTKLKTAIEKEFLSRGIKSEVRIFSDLLEITDTKWQNAVEGYLNSQRFYIILEPQHYKVALEVYNKIKKEVHTVGLINTGKLDINSLADMASLAYVIKSDNRYAKAYAVYLLNRVVRCEEVQSLKEHKIAITPDCMLYQNYAVRKIDEKIYNTPFIGAFALEIQLKNKQNELMNLKEDIKKLNEKSSVCTLLIEKLNTCKIDVLEENLNAPKELRNYEELIAKEKIELKKAEANPSYIQIQIQIEECRKVVDSKDREHSLSNQRIGELEKTLKANKTDIENLLGVILNLENIFNLFCEKDAGVTILGLNKFNEQIKIKTPETIVQNFSPLKVGLENKKNEFCMELIKLQSSYCSKYDCDLGSGYEQVHEYIMEHQKLVLADIIKYEEELKKAKDNCQLEFRESFLARLKENIENAKLEFRNLNYALRDIYYGEDSYKFELTHNKQKESIYQMITSKNNEAGFNLWSNSFEEEYKEEMEDLFAKLTAYDDKGEKVLTEYTDYRSYLDYDIVVEKKDGTLQRFSKIYGEKSGGETQTPYYVAIAASFVQLYKHGDTIRIIMLDEAFDKMDDNRISAMMDFFNSQDFQIILATPPAKIEEIGEKVDTILMAIREGSTSIIEEYDL